jgi:hypothetical protein
LEVPFLGTEYFHLFPDPQELVAFARDRNLSKLLAIPVEVAA